MTKAELARRVGVTLGAVTRWTAVAGPGRKPNEEKVVWQIAQELRLSSDQTKELFRVWEKGEQNEWAALLTQALVDRN